ncbi:patatin-like phospholipase family protein [Adhaeribacter sp. BT258]|uniref:Patatin-like phospholipase family protein n=1 Tax=Adhaeribacter terrigena TaxID=2793070 RepID=A0ABS1C1S2_9BACT|nr:patatin-like phospholipase family protein [Adhaeribacter terrigena]MBK0403322.1 patatin-like phospholipase family protein [Adhaeribacter terrigena]
MKPFRILSIDGGGLRGIVPVMILQEIQRLLNGKPIHEAFDLIAGTSTGGLIAAGLTVSQNGLTPLYTLQDLQNIYSSRGQHIFPVRGKFLNVLDGITSLWNPEYSEKGIRKVLEELMGEYRLMDCLTPLLITAFDLKHNEPLLFKSRTAAYDPEANACLFDVCRATSAGPTYLPAHTFRFEGREVTCIDGGVYINNPTLGAIAEISRYKKDAFYNRPDLDWSDIHVLSLGTGHYTGLVSNNQAKGWGKANWARPIIDIMMHGVNKTTHSHAEELLDHGNYLRLTIDIEVEKFARMTDASEEARLYLTDQVEKQFLQNSTLQKRVKGFLERAGLFN